MFGLGFSEIIIVIIIAILFLGPDKLPSAMVEVAKFFRNMKNAVGSVKDSFEEEVHVSDIKKEVMSYKQDLLNASQKLEDTTAIDEFVLGSDKNATPVAPQETQKVTFEKKIKEEKTDV